jgi:hypothetical protein
MPMFIIIYFSEFFIDWVKHGFIIKFNNISPKVSLTRTIEKTIHLFEKKILLSTEKGLRRLYIKSRL